MRAGPRICKEKSDAEGLARQKHVGAQEKHIDVYREIEEEDVALTEFSDEIDGWVIEALKSAGCDTAKSVLELSIEEIAQRADLEIEQAEQVVAILKAEFE